MGLAVKRFVGSSPIASTRNPRSDGYFDPGFVASELNVSSGVSNGDGPWRPAAWTSNPSPWGADAAESVTHSFELILGGDHRLRMGHEPLSGSLMATRGPKSSSPTSRSCSRIAFNSGDRLCTTTNPRDS